MFTKISRNQLRAVTGWSVADLANRGHAGQLCLAYGLTLPTATDTYIGLDPFSLLLSDALVAVGFTRALSSQFVRDFHRIWLAGLEQIEWPELFPPPEPMLFAPGPLAIAEGKKEIPPNAGIHLAIVKNPDGSYQAASGTLLDNVKELAPVLQAANAAGVLTPIIQFPLGHVYKIMLARAAQAGVDLGAPFTRPERHPEHRDWYAAVEVHRALSSARQKVRKPPGPTRAKAKRRKRVREAEAKMQERA